MFRLIVFLACLLGITTNNGTADIIDLIQTGNLDEARDEISRLSTATRRDGTLLLGESLLESDGVKSLQLLTSAVKAGPDPRYTQEILYLNALYYQSDEQLEPLFEVCDSYLQRWENGKYRAEMMRMSVYACDRTGQREKADRTRKLLIRENAQNEFSGLAALDQAADLFNLKKYGEAITMCRKPSQSQHDVVAAPALYMLAMCAAESGRTDDALFYYNLLKDGYPDAVGLDDLTDRLTGLEAKSEDGKAEKVTGTVYSVQVGVFAVSANADNMAGRMKKYGEPVVVREKTVSNKKYFVVSVGRFPTTEKAMTFKARLEEIEKEAYQVIAL